MPNTCQLWPPHRHSSLTVAELADMLAKVPSSARVHVWWRDFATGVNVVSMIVDVAPGRSESGEIVALLIGGEGALPRSRVGPTGTDSPG